MLGCFLFCLGLALFFCFFFTFLHMVLYASDPEFLLESPYISVHSAGFPFQVQRGESVIGIVTKIIKS